MESNSIHKRFHDFTWSFSGISQGVVAHACRNDHTFSKAQFYRLGLCRDNFASFSFDEVENMKPAHGVICHVVRKLEPVNGKEQQVSFPNALFLPIWSSTKQVRLLAEMSFDPGGPARRIDIGKGMVKMDMTQVTRKVLAQVIVDFERIDIW